MHVGAELGTYRSSAEADIGISIEHVESAANRTVEMMYNTFKDERWIYGLSTRVVPCAK